MEPLFTLRKPRLEDLDQVIYINQRCLPENYSSFFFTDLYMHFPETFFVAEKDGKIVGYIMCRIESGFSGLHLTKKGHIISLAVLPEYRNMGIGYALVKEALHAMWSHYNAKECYLEVRVSNIPAVNLYKKAGFTMEKTVKGYYADGENAYIMSRKLDFNG
ncbi:MAG: ribosomal protein S18-alanine N-acetyltransferase [Candidatus Bathyarchaeia archaeon]